MKTRIKPPKDLKKVTCTKTEQMFFEELNPNRSWVFDRPAWCKERFILGKTYDCFVDKSGALVIEKDELGFKQRASYERYFNPNNKIIVPRKQKYIYKIHSVLEGDLHIIEVEQFLNSASIEGWELISVVHKVKEISGFYGGRSVTNYYFKKPCQD